MTETDPFGDFDRAAAAAGGIVDRIGVERFGDPTPCSEWDVRQLLDHLIGGTTHFHALLTGGARAEVSSAEPAVAFREALAALRAEFASADGLTREVGTSFGTQSGATLMHMRTTEMIVHGWDLAKATGQSTDLDPEVAQRCLDVFRRVRGGNRRADGMFGAPQPVADDAPPADQLAAYAGRRVD